MQGDEEGRVKTEREQSIRVVKKKIIKGGHHGGAWKVAFADFMTSMMALFLVLWLVTQSSEVRSAIAGYFQDPLGRGNEFGSSIIPGDGQPMTPLQPSIQARPTEGRRDQLLQLSQQIRKTVADDSAAAQSGLGQHVLIEITPDGLRITLVEDSTDVFFKSGSPQPLPRAQTLFRSMGGVLGAAGAILDVEGHTDARQYPKGAPYDNWELSAGRANTTRRLLLEGGLTDQQVKAVRGLADRQPRLPDPMAPGNRRVTLLVTLPDGGPPVASAPPPATAPPEPR